MPTFVALYRGNTLADCRLLALSMEPEVVRDFAVRLLNEVTPTKDSVLNALDGGRRKALQLVREEFGDERSLP